MEPVTGWIDPAWVQRQLHEIRGVAEEAEVRVREKALWEAVLAATARRTCENPIECARTRTSASSATPQIGRAHV